VSRNKTSTRETIRFLSEPDSDEETFDDYLAEIIGKIANGFEPNPNFFVLCDNVLSAAPKSNGDVRRFFSHPVLFSFFCFVFLLVPQAGRICWNSSTFRQYALRDA
jgi:hypothetical protein